MKEKKDDRRIRYTKKVIRESLIHLLSQKPIAEITVKEICELADVNRSTFYAHYKDPYDLIGAIKQGVIEEVNSWMERVVSPVDGFSAHQVMKLVFDYVLANAELCKVLLGEYGDEGLPEEIMMLAQAQVMREWPGSADAAIGLSDYLITFGIHAGVSVVKKWLEKGLIETPSQMADLTIRLIYHGMNSVLSKRPVGA
jgi:AcrR family transcriptional regulator